jgi:hypothetical protein
MSTLNKHVSTRSQRFGDRNADHLARSMVRIGWGARDRTWEWRNQNPSSLQQYQALGNRRASTRGETGNGLEAVCLPVMRIPAGLPRGPDHSTKFVTGTLSAHCGSRACKEDCKQ